MARTVVVNADDFGLTPGVNRGIVEAHIEGIVTSTSAMVRQPAAPHAAELATAHPELGVGLHVDLGEWAFTGGRWQALYTVVDTEDGAAVASEVDHQVRSFHALFGRPPTHLDSHQHVHQSSPVRETLTAVAAELGIPLRGNGVVRYVGDFYGQLSKGDPHHDAITVDALVTLLGSLPPGVSEIACHPGYTEGLTSTGTMYVAEREQELRVLCDPRVAAGAAEAGVELVSFVGLS